MERDRAIDILQSHAAEARGLGATAFYLFGLTARDEAREAAMSTYLSTMTRKNSVSSS
jgi:hypothetical protein